jgi:hypothetical protein
MESWKSRKEPRALEGVCRLLHIDVCRIPAFTIQRRWYRWYLVHGEAIDEDYVERGTHSDSQSSKVQDNTEVKLPSSIGVVPVNLVVRRCYGVRGTVVVIVTTTDDRIPRRDWWDRPIHCRWGESLILTHLLSDQSALFKHQRLTRLFVWTSI